MMEGHGEDRSDEEPPRKPYKPPKRLSEAERLREFTLAAELDPGHVLCPLCCQAYVLDNLAGRQWGVCEACYRRGLAEAAREEERQLLARREYDMARQNLHRTRERLGLPKEGAKGKEKTRMKPLL